LAKFLTNVAICVLAVAGTYYWHDGKVKQAENKVRVELAQESKRQIDQLTIKALRTESELKDQIRKAEDDKQIQKAIDADRINGLVASLRNRPERRTGESNLPGDSCNCETPSGSTGAGLYKEDGIFLIGEASRAESVKVELLACYRQYDEVKSVMDKFKENNK
jgi:hypothetical protein